MYPAAILYIIKYILPVLHAVQVVLEQVEHAIALAY